MPVPLVYHRPHGSKAPVVVNVDGVKYQFTPGQVVSVENKLAEHLLGPQGNPNFKRVAPDVAPEAPQLEPEPEPAESDAEVPEPQEGPKKRKKRGGES